MDRDKALEMALSQIDKQFGKGSIMRLGEQSHVGVEAIPTGALARPFALAEILSRLAAKAEIIYSAFGH